MPSPECRCCAEARPGRYLLDFLRGALRSGHVRPWPYPGRAAGDSVADSLLRLPLLRAMFCELIGQKVGMIRETN